MWLLKHSEYIGPDDSRASARVRRPWSNARFLIVERMLPEKRMVARRVQLGDGVSKFRNGATGPAGASVVAQAIGYALLPFFAKNVLISAFVGSRKGCWLFPARAVPVGLGNRA